MHNSIDYFVIFGAAVREDGSPSGSLTRRTQGAYRAAIAHDQFRFIPSGGQGAYGPPEASVMRDLLIGLGAKPDHIIPDELSHDTFSTVINAWNIIRSQKNCRHVYVCTSPYHAPRCVMLFWLIGAPVRAVHIPGDFKALGPLKWVYYVFRECAAIIWDGLLMLLKKARQ